MKHRVCECAETRRNLERENKPGGVKIGFCKFITVSLFCLLTSPLWADEGYSSCTDQTCCSGYSGVYWTDTDTCSSCNYSGVTPFGYCTGGARNICNSDYPKAAEFASSPDHCYRDIACAGENDAAPDENNNNARLYANGCIEYGDDDSHCFDNPQNNSTSAYHMEGTGDNAKCYSNTRACSLFDYRKAGESSIHSASDSSSDVIITGTARWYIEIGTNARYWKVNECYKKENNENISGAYCTGVTIAQASNDNNTVNNVTDVLVYYNSQRLNHNNSNCPSCWRYRCTSCLAGHEPNRNVQGQYSSCQGNDVIICGCAETTPGYYSTGGDFCDYNFNETIFNGNNFADNFCPSPSESSYVYPCSEPGMTSDSGATSSGQCHYGSGNGTQFCDAFGCVYLDNLTFNDNGYSWNGDVHLVGVRFDENSNYMCPDATPTPRYFWGYDKDGNPINAQGDTVNCGN